MVYCTSIFQNCQGGKYRKREKGFSRKEKKGLGIFSGFYYREDFFEK